MTRFHPPQGSGASLAFRGGTIGTADTPDRLFVERGSVAEWPADVPESVEQIDLRGGYLGPAFGDGHAHPLLAARELLGPSVRSADGVPGILSAVRDWADAHPGPGWIVGGSYDATLQPGGLFDARLLDSVVADRPVVLRAWDYHSVWCNSRALELAGLDAGTVDPPDGVIPRRPDGSPLGVLIESGAVDRVLRLAPAPQVTELAYALGRATATLASHGVAWVQEAWTDPDDVPAWLRCAERGLLAVDADLALRADPNRWPAQRDELAGLRAVIETAPGLSCSTVKFFVDGVVENYTAALLSEYVDRCTRGLPVWSDDALREAVLDATERGFDVHLHAIGDAAVRSALDAVAAVRERFPVAERAVTVAHAQLIDEADLGRFAALGVTVCFQPLWAAPDSVMTDLTLPRLGEQRALQYRMRSVLATGARISFGSDWPVTSPDVLAGIATAVTRQTPEREPAGGWQPAERITIEDALTAATLGVAEQSRSTPARGTLAVGARADLVWLSRDPRVVPADELRSIVVLGTWRRGLRTF